MFALLSLLLGAVPLLPSPGSEARELTCGPGSAKRRLVVARVTDSDEGLSIVWLVDSVGGAEPAPAKGKPTPGCQTLPAVDGWNLKPVATWVRQPDGSWLGPSGERAALSCQATLVKGVVEPTALERRKGAGCPQDDAFELTGGAPGKAEVLRCVMSWKGRRQLLVFGKAARVEHVRSADDCFRGAGWRVIPPAGATAR